MSQFIDYAQVEITSGDGGNGSVAWRREKYEPMGGPAGGNGGRGGSIYIETSVHLSTLSEFKFVNKFIAANGQRGGSGRKDGKSGQDLVLKVPLGTVIKDAESKLDIADLENAGDRLLVAAGGRGGRGNASFATPILRAPYFCEPGEGGVQRKLILELKLLADVGLVGLPNAGKSTLLAALTKAKPKIADYPFSTLEPNLGTVAADKGPAFVIADIPGLIAGASEGVGLGHDFLRHIERTRLLVHVIDASSTDLLTDIKTIDTELKEFNVDLSGKDQIIALNKIDLLPAEEIANIEKQISKITEPRTIIALSGVTRQGIKELLILLKDRLLTNPIAQPQPDQLERRSDRKSAYEQSQGKGRLLTADDKATTHPDSEFEVSRQKGGFLVTGDRILRHALVVNHTNPESIQHLGKVLRSIGVIDELNKLQVQIGDQIQIGQMYFIFGEDIY